MSDGKFQPGCKPGPGRPKRSAVESDYIAIVRDLCPPEKWRSIVERQVELAEAGDPKSLVWLSRWLLGRRTDATLLELAAAEIRDKDAGDELVESRADETERQQGLFEALNGK